MTPFMSKRACVRFIQKHWFEYAQQLRQWLKPQGSLWVMFMQMLRPAATEEGVIHGPPYHCDINAMRALFPERDWVWSRPPYAKVPHPSLFHELALRLIGGRLRK